VKKVLPFFRRERFIAPPLAEIKLVVVVSAIFVTSFRLNLSANCHLHLKLSRLELFDGTPQKAEPKGNLDNPQGHSRQQVVLNEGGILKFIYNERW